MILRNIVYSVCGAVLAVAMTCPVFVFAKSTCVVAVDGDADYKSIAKALEKGCKNIRVREGTYADTVTIGKDVQVRGDSRKAVKVTGGVVLQQGAQLRDVTVAGSGGITAEKGAHVRVINTTITGAKIGVMAAGGGAVYLDNVSIRDSGKGMYMQFGTKVTIKKCTVEDNKEEGIDLRANTDGSITGCTIVGNGESGIEVILGRSNLTISGNTIKKNKSSGIATQFYPEAKKEGDVRITKNTITGNSHYAINCKKPSGGKSHAGYWDNSLTMTGNTMSGNKHGDFSDACKLADQTMEHATMTRAEIAEAQARLEEEQRKKEEAIATAKTERQKAAEQKAQEEQARQEEERRRKEQEEHDARTVVDAEARLGEIVALQEMARTLQERMTSRPAWKVFFVGVDKVASGQIAESVLQQRQNVQEVHALIATIGDIAQHDDLAARADDVAHVADELEDFLVYQQERFSLFGWMRK